MRKVPTLTCFLSDEQKREATAAVVRAGAEFVKTSTGFGTGGATLDDVRLMADVIAGLGAQERVQLGAAGGVTRGPGSGPGRGCLLGGSRGVDLLCDARVSVELRLLHFSNAPMSPVT